MALHKDPAKTEENVNDLLELANSQLTKKANTIAKLHEIVDKPDLDSMKKDNLEYLLQYYQSKAKKIEAILRK